MCQSVASVTDTLKGPHCILTTLRAISHAQRALIYICEGERLNCLIIGL